MKSLFVGAVAVLAMAVQAHAAPVPPTTVPIAFISNQFYGEGVTDSVTDVRLSPFAGTSADGRPYDVIYGNNSDNFGVGIGGFGAFYTPDQFAGSNASIGTFTFLDGSPDTYNYLTFYSIATGIFTTLSGSQIATPTNGSGFQVVTLTGLGAYDYVGFGSLNSNAFEYAALSAVPLPASAPLFGAALILVGAAGYGMKRKKVAAAA